MQSNYLHKLIQEILLEMFVKLIDLNSIKEKSKIVIIFQDNKIELEKIKDKFKVIQIDVSERIKPGDILMFLETAISPGDEIQCSIYRKNNYNKYLKTNFVHKFSPIKSIEVI